MTSLDSVQIESIPGSIDEFVAMRDKIADSPQGGAAAMVIALLLLADNEDLGVQCLAAAADAGALEKGREGYDGLQLRSSDLRLAKSQVLGNSHILKSYLRGATPENGYEMPDSPYVMGFSSNKYSGDPESGTFKVFVDCSGASTPRPVTLRKSKAGQWLALEWSSLIVGVRAPE